MVQTLAQVQKLEKYVQSCGEDKIISMTIFKLFDYKIKEYENHIKELIVTMKEYEQKYDMESRIFYQMFTEGKLGDAMDFVDWASMCQMLKRIMERKHFLEE